MSRSGAVLGFDTSGPYCAAAVLRGGGILAERHEEMAKGQAECLMPMLEDALSDAGLAWQDIDRIGVGVGPGNFTGIRVSVSAARGLALALGRPALGISLLEALAYGVHGPVLASIDARRGKLFLQLFGRGACSDWGPQVASIDALPAEVMHPGLSCVGHEALRMAEAVGGEMQSAAYAPASAVAWLAAERNVVRGERPAPLYLRDAGAEPLRAESPAVLP